MALTATGKPEVSGGKLRPEPEAARGRVCRYLLPPSHGPGDTAGGDHAGAEFHRQERPGALCRNLQLQQRIHRTGHRHHERAEMPP